MVKTKMRIYLEYNIINIIKNLIKTIKSWFTYTYSRHWGVMLRVGPNKEWIIDEFPVSFVVTPLLYFICSLAFRV